ncbi:hypothetical protein [Bradyrhizobium sp. CCBAU 51753]|uniref:hypothetical protein n=1 Tax=Bradyrhizobium sp. CCBAU 51753 TaxID=1325100 RepID=UPI00188BDC08|nr:hypothetical protein [Bradyrhizobium sp. CCBAU 51753]
MADLSTHLKLFLQTLVALRKQRHVQISRLTRSAATELAGARDVEACDEPSDLLERGATARLVNHLTRVGMGHRAKAQFGDLWGWSEASASLAASRSAMVAVALLGKRPIFGAKGQRAASRQLMLRPRTSASFIGSDNKLAVSLPFWSWTARMMV